MCLFPRRPFGSTVYSGSGRLKKSQFDHIVIATKDNQRPSFLLPYHSLYLSQPFHLIYPGRAFLDLRLAVHSLVDNKDYLSTYPPRPRSLQFACHLDHLVDSLLCIITHLSSCATHQQYSRSRCWLLPRIKSHSPTRFAAGSNRRKNTFKFLQAFHQ